MLFKSRNKARMSLPTNSIQNCAEVSSQGNKLRKIHKTAVPSILGTRDRFPGR